MRLLQKLLRKPTLAPGIVAISFYSHGFGIAVCRYRDNDRPQLVYCDFVAANEQQRLQQLQSTVKNHHLEIYDAHILLAPDQYRTISIETPQVPAEELKQAVAWRVADVLDYPVDQTALDFYPLPASNRPNSPAMLEVVACSLQITDSLSRLCKEAGLTVKVIDIQETALRNLATLLPENQQGIAILHLQQQSGRIIIQKNDSIFLSRKIDHGYARLTQGLLTDDPDQQRMEQNNLALEIQRSLDYVEHFYDIPPITSLAMVLMPNNTYDIINFLNIHYGITARAMDLSAIIESDTSLTDAIQNLCGPCIGASLRRYVENLG